MANYKQQNDQVQISTALAAVAIQDHIVRSLKLDQAQHWNRRPAASHNVRNVSQKSSGYGMRKDARASLNESHNSDFEVEYVIEKSGPPPSLAEKMGLIKVHGNGLSETEWMTVKGRANNRCDFEHPCVICKEELGISEQVLLSCSHVFHKNCLNAFERFMGRKTCPMCRREQYQTRVVHDGKTFYRNKCATVIQAAWRGYVIRRMYSELRKYHPPNDARLRKRYYEEKLRCITDRLIATHAGDVDGFLSELNRDLEISRKLFNKFDNVTRQISEEQWRDIIAQGLGRDCTDCSICLMPLRGRYLYNNNCITASGHQLSDSIEKESNKRTSAQLRTSELLNQSQTCSPCRPSKRKLANLAAGGTSFNEKCTSSYSNNRGAPSSRSSGNSEFCTNANRRTDPTYGQNVGLNCNSLSKSYVYSKSRSETLVSKFTENNGALGDSFSRLGQDGTRRIQKEPVTRNRDTKNTPSERSNYTNGNAIKGSKNRTANIIKCPNSFDTAASVSASKKNKFAITKPLNKNPGHEKAIVVLSCTHAYHSVCLQALEDFSSEESRFVCPICRSPYQKRVVETDDSL